MRTTVWTSTLLAGLSVIGLLGCATPASPPAARLESPLVSPRLERFESEAAFRAYLRETATLARSRGFYWAGRQSGLTNAGAMADNAASQEMAAATDGAMGAPPPPPPPPAPPPPPSQSSAAPVVSVQAPAAPGDAGSITNNQERAVDEGDVVKRIGRFLVVLQDGRLFTVDTAPGGPGLRVVGRQNVYRRATAGVWIDEMLVFGNRIIVTGYSYQARATELSVFSLSQSGQLTREGVYYVSSNDYYDPENYASRIVGDNLVFYSHLALNSMDPKDTMNWPMVRRLVSEGTRNELISDGSPLFDASNIYRPVQATLQPTVHAISVCPLGGLEAGDELTCRNTAVVGPSGRDFYITADSAYIWSALGDREGLLFTASPACRRASDTTNGPAGVPATVFQIPLDGSPPKAMLVHGQPRNQFSFSASNGEFRALLDQACSRDLTYFHAPLATFSGAPVAASPALFTTLPAQPDGAQSLENRFTDTHLVYAWRTTSDYSILQGREISGLTSQVVVVPMASPSAVTLLEAPHDVMRMERVGPNDIVLTGYQDMRGLRVSVLDLDGPVARIATSLLLPGRFESEGRSHAFNSNVDAAGNGLMGLPTTRARSEAGRVVFESQDSDVSFLTVAGGDTLSLAGHLRTVLTQPHPSYECEVSCVDWYGNARPIFTDGRIFALTGSEIVEGRLRDGQVIEARRVDLTAPLD